MQKTETPGIRIVPPTARKLRHFTCLSSVLLTCTADNYRNIGITVKSPAVKTRYRQFYKSS